MRHRPKHLLEYAALRLLAGLFSILPYRLSLAIGYILARIGFLLFRDRVREAERRIHFVFGPNPGPLSARQIAWRSWRNLAFDIVEILRVSRSNPAWVSTNSNADEIMAPLQAQARTGRGAIIAVPHMGNWETAALACHYAGIPIFSIAATQKNPLVDAYLNRLRRYPGIETLARGSGLMRDVLRRLKAGGFLAILPDVRVRTPDVPVHFLGGTANIGSGAARFARQAGVPIFTCRVIRRGWAYQFMYVSPPIWPDPSIPKDADITRMTQELLGRIEEWIRAMPEQWFWFNRRWILDPLDPVLPTANTDAALQPTEGSLAEPSA